ncbi:unnamed protein product [Linum tenue]|uniref:Uncharacterized protein n=1 Tax=Linum tenue TaxID=586396 RepID=A0AAV0L7J7_9ROSI|nr:unnamed protein product [Linum tenue]
MKQPYILGTFHFCLVQGWMNIGIPHEDSLCNVQTPHIKLNLVRLFSVGQRTSMKAYLTQYPKDDSKFAPLA